MINSPMQAIAKELKTRKRIEAIYNSIAEDFETKDLYDQYLEEREDIVFNLVNNVDVAETELKIVQYQRNNHETILRNQARQAEASRLLTKHAEEADVEPAQPSTTDNAPATYRAQAQPGTAMAAVPVPLSLPTKVDLSTSGAVRAMGKASGWSADLAVQRAIAEAFNSVLIR